MGCSAGEPVAENKDLFGAVVQRGRAHTPSPSRSSRLALSMISVWESGSRSRTGVVPLRGFDEPVRLYEVRWRE